MFLKELESHLPRRMWEQMAIVLAFLVAIPLMLLGWLLINASQTAVKTSVLRDQRQIVTRASSELGEFIRRPHDLLRSTAAILGTLRADVWKEETALVELALNQEIFGRLAMIGPEGKERVSSDLGTPLTDRSSEKAFQEASRGAVHMSDIYFSADHEPYVTMAVPVKHLGKTVGVLAAEVRLRGFWDIVDAIRIGETGRADVVSPKGVLIAAEDKKRVLANEDLSHQYAVKAALAGETGSVEIADEAEGSRWLKAYAPIPGPGWGLILKQSADEAFSFLHLMKIEAWILIVASLGLALLASLLLAHMLVNPIQVLARKMDKVAAGDLDQRMGLQRADEIGSLMSAFDQMTEKLKKARDSEKLALIGKAAAAITHDLKNALVTVSTYIGLLPQRRDDAQFLKRFSTVVPRELEEWKNMLNEISDFSRKSGFEMHPLAPSAVLEDFAQFVRPKLDEHKVAFDVSIEPGLPNIRGNAQKLKQALLNIVLNAIDVMPEGGELDLWAARKEGRLEIGIRDTGKGIPADKLDAVFEPFYSTKANGLGLGLAVCREIIEQHGGKLTAQSVPGAGTTFLVSLPA